MFKREFVTASFLLITAGIVAPPPSFALDCDSACAGASCYLQVSRHFLIYEKAVDAGRNSFARITRVAPIGIGRDAGHGPGQQIDGIIDPMIHLLDSSISDVAVDAIVDPVQRWHFAGSIGQIGGNSRLSSNAPPVHGFDFGVTRGTSPGMRRVAYRLDREAMPVAENWMTMHDGRIEGRKAGNGRPDLPAALRARQGPAYPYTRVGIRFAGERGVRDEGLSLSALDTFPKPGNWAMLVAGLLGMCAVARPRIFFS